jgi:two-component system, chemotaxis family, CheB/CheR fusion protein
MDNVVGNGRGLESSLPFASDLDGDKALADSDFFRKVLDALPVAIYATDARGRITYFNEAAAALWGNRPELGRSEWCGSWRLYWPDGTFLPHSECPMATAVKEKRPIRGMEAVAERPDGSRVPVVPFPTPIYGEAGELIGAVNMVLDISDRKRADQHLRRIASIVDSCDDAIISKDLNGTILSWNHGAERLFGYSAEEAVGKPITMLIPPERLDEEPRIVERLRRGERIYHYETIRRRKDGSPVEISLTVSPIKDAEGKVTGASKVARDITERKRAQEQQKLLLFEMRHRIKNTLATVQAIASQTLRSASADERSAFVARLCSLGSAYDLLTSERWNSALLSDVVSAALQPFQEKHRERFLIEGPSDVRLDSKTSLGVAMMLHELATNAVKYGALSNQSGHVSVEWELVPCATSARVKLHWQERGGPPVVPPKHKGFGSYLIEHVLGSESGRARVDYDPRGLDCVVEVVL